MNAFLKDKIQIEVDLADELSKAGRIEDAFHHLERAHVLGQGNTFEHTRVHLRMLLLGSKMHSLREIFGQIIRVIGAATKTPLGIYPSGNTGGSNVWFFKPMPIAADLRKILDESKSH